MFCSFSFSLVKCFGPLDTNNEKIVTRCRMTAEQRLHKWCRIDVFQPAGCVSLSLLNHTVQSAFRKHTFLAELYFLGLLSGHCVVNSTLEFIAPALLLRTPAEIFFMNTDLLCSR